MRKGLKAKEAATDSSLETEQVRRGTEEGMVMFPCDKLKTFLLLYSQKKGNNFKIYELF